MSAIFSLCLPILLIGQLNPVQQTIQAKQGSTNTNVIVNSIDFDPNPISPSSSFNYDTLHFQNIGNGQWELWFKSSDVGEVEVVIEYFDAGPIPGFPEAHYSTINYEIKPTIVNPGNDFYLTSGATVSLDVLSNDVSESSLSLQNISHVSGGTANISNGKIDFTLDGGETRGFVQYITEDTTGTQNHAIACILQENSLGGQVNASLHNKESFKLHLDRSDYTIGLNPSNGNISQVNSVLWTYEANTDFSGTDVVEFVDANGNILRYDLNVLDKSDNTGFIRNDKVFVAVEDMVDFDVFENDLRSGFNIVDFSSELTHNGNGDFSYTPPSGFQGDLIFYYKVFTGFTFEEAFIYVHVDDQAPYNNEEYSFSVLKDEVLSLDYAPEFDDYQLNLINDGAHGQVVILDDQGQEVTNCETITGEHTIVYSPNAGYSGDDYFEVEYCTESGNCSLVKISVDVINQTANDCVCHNDCVWPGDFNADGYVNELDFLIGYYYLGKSGEARTNGSSSWEAQFGNDWLFNVKSNGTDQKHLDANADGFVNTDDLAIQMNNYGKYNNLLHKKAFILEDMPLQLVPHETEVDSGEVLHLDIVLGDSTNPALDFTGLGFQLNIDPNLIDSSSVNLTVHEDSWIGQSSSLNSLLEVPSDGQINIGISTLSKLSASGAGVVAEVDFIVEEDIEGWRLKDELISMSIRLNQAVFMNAKGEQYRLPDHTIIAKVRPGNLDELKVEEPILMFPNPATQFTKLESKSDIIEVEVYNTNGILMDIHSNINSNEFIVPVAHLSEGMYMLRVQTASGFESMKLSKIRL